MPFKGTVRMHLCPEPSLATILFFHKVFGLMRAAMREGLRRFKVTLATPSAGPRFSPRMPRRLVSPAEDLPPGFRYQPDFLTEAEERALLAELARLELQPFEFRGYTARRRVVEYGWEYDFGSRQATRAAPIAPFLLPLRERAARFAGLFPELLVEAVVTEYLPGAPLGWHRDVPQFETILGISLGSAGRMRFKPYRGEGKLVSAMLEPRSLYVIQGDARWKSQHSMPPVETTRHSITFRTLREKKKQKDAA